MRARKQKKKKFDKVKLEEEMPYPYLVFKQLDRVAKSLTEGTIEFLRAVEATEILISPFEDKEYEKEIKELDAAYDDRVKKIQRGRSQITDPVDETKVAVASYEKAWLKLNGISAVGSLRELKMLYINNSDLQVKTEKFNLQCKVSLSQATTLSC